MLFFRGEEDQQTLRTCVILSLQSLLLFGEHGKGEKTRDDDDDGKNEKEKHTNNNGSIVFDDDVNDDVNKVVFEDVPLPRRALSSSHTFSFVFVKRFRTLERRSTSKASLFQNIKPYTTTYI